MKRTLRCTLQRTLVWLLLLTATQNLFAQNRTVTGKITDPKTGAGISGASVLVKGTTIGTTTAENGTYSLSVPANASILTFSSVGFGTQEAKIGTNGTLNITLKSGSGSLDEVVVVGYGTLRRGEVASAVSSVRPDDFRQSGARNALDVAQGKVAGLTITRTGGSNPNSGVNIQIRGINSVTAGVTNPLIVIDGIPGGNLDLLQQDDIEAIDVLKDGSAAAIYGTRGNAGVILVTTKKGKSGPARFDYSTYFRRERVARKPEFYSAEELRALIASGKLGTNVTTRDLPAWGGVSTNMFDAVLNKENLSQYHNLSMSGGTASTNYRASLFYQNLQGISQQNGRTNYGGRLNINQKGFNNRLSSQINIATNYNNANLLGGGSWETILTRLPTMPIYNPNGTFFEDLTTTSSTNLISVYNQEKNRRIQQTSSLDGKFTLDIFKGIKASVFGAIQRNSYNDNQYKDIASRSSVAGSTTPPTGDAPNGPLAVTPNGTGYAYKGSFLNNNYAVEPTIEYSSLLGDNHSVSAVAGYSYRYEVNESFGAANSGYVNDLYEENNLGAGTFQAATRSSMISTKNDNTLIAYFGRVNYTFKDKYISQVIFRHEGSSRFGVNNKWANFPAAALGWNISKEDFMDNLTFVNNLKLRVGYGVTGNTGFANYASLVTLGTGGFYLYPDGVWRQTYGPNRNPNPNLRWEKKKELNIGLDFSLFNGRLGGALEVYRRNTNDLLYTYTSQLPAFVTESIYANVGSIKNQGVEVTLNAVPVRARDFSWSVDFTGSTQSNILTKFSSDIYRGTYIESADIGSPGALGNAIRTVEGGPLGSFYGKRFAGFGANGQWLFYTRAGKAVTFDQINTSNDPATTDLAVLGNGIPKYYASLNNEFRYKNLDLRVFFRGKFGYKILNSTAIAYANRTTSTNLLKSTFTKYAQLNSAPTANPYQYSDYYLENGNYVKLDEITLGYNLKVKTSYIRNLRVYANVANAALFTKYTGNDPDFVNDTGLGAGFEGRGPYPSTRSFLLGLNIGF